MDEFDALVELGEALGYDEATARRFAIGRDGSETGARAQWAITDPGVQRGVAAVTEAAQTALRMSATDAHDHALRIAERELGRPLPVGQRVTAAESYLNEYARSLRAGGISPAPVRGGPSGTVLREGAAPVPGALYRIQVQETSGRLVGER